MKDEKNNIIWNIGIKKQGNNLTVIMPDEITGEVEAITGDGYLVSWPLNPHFTGEETIKMILGASSNFDGLNFL